jgi:hypothetical protein
VPEGRIQPETGRAAATFNARLAAHYLALAEEIAPRLHGEQRAESLNRLEQEFDNLRAALDWFAHHGDVEQGWRLTTALWDYWRWRLPEGRVWLGQFLTLPHLSGHGGLRAQALDLAGVLAFYAVIRNDTPRSSSVRRDRAACRSLMEESLTIRRALGDTTGIAQSLLHNGTRVRLLEGDFRAARAMYEESLALYETADHRQGAAYAAYHLAYLAVHEGDLPAARLWVEESRARSGELGLGDDWAVTLLDSGARHAAVHGHPERALRLAAATRARREGFHLPLFLQDNLERTIAPFCRTQDEAARTAARLQGQAMTLQQAITYALEEPSSAPP